MQTPRIPSFFKTPKSKTFDYKPMYYDKRKEELERLKKESKKQKKTRTILKYQTVEEV